jgi:hypothetical protein
VSVSLHMYFFTILGLGMHAVYILVFSFTEIILFTHT